MMTAASNPQDPMPVVQRSGGGNTGMWIFLAILLAGGIGLFTAMSASREASQAPRVTAAGSENTRIVAPRQRCHARATHAIHVIHAILSVVYVRFHNCSMPCLLLLLCHVSLGAGFC